MGVLGNCTIAAIFLLGTGGCGASGEGPSERPDAEAVPGPELGTEDEIDAIDLVVESRDALHVTWREVDGRSDRSGLPEYRTLYAYGSREGSGSGSGGGTTWSRPETLPFRDPPRLVLAGGLVYILAGPRLESLRREGEGSWRSLGPLLPESIPGVSAFDVAALGDDLLVAAIARRGEGGLALFVVFGGLEPALRQVAEHEPSLFDQPAPRLLAQGDRLHLLWAVNGQERTQVDRRGRRSEQILSKGHVFYARSDDRGATWSAPAEVTADALELPSTIDSVELAADGSELLAFYGSFGLHSSRSTDGRQWSRPVRVSGTSGSSLAGGTDVRSLAAAGGAIVWVDERYRESDRRWWKPLGGWPWSDSPDWVDNDLLLLHLREVRSALDSAGVEPRRLTPDLTHVGPARADASSGQIYVLWAGRHPVGKERDSRGAVPTLFLHRLPRS